ncbi:hypothetical protein IFM89_006206 [Coptis chinensis]|uniref:Uncharacterized protein n=1 Tax=Coptis chinensis TaxID=261450 RepID=A0A835H917_9MAGN|nr:hypothetical protein IFM89_006206 [Coptis chinensis]
MALKLGTQNTSQNRRSEQFAIIKCSVLVPVESGLMQDLFLKMGLYGKLSHLVLRGTQVGEVVFNGNVTVSERYQEIHVATDPSYAFMEGPKVCLFDDISSYRKNRLVMPVW